MEQTGNGGGVSLWEGLFGRAELWSLYGYRLAPVPLLFVAGGVLKAFYPLADWSAGQTAAMLLLMLGAVLFALWPVLARREGGDYAWAVASSVLWASLLCQISHAVVVLVLNIVER